MDTNINSIKTWLSNNKVCFVTNSFAMPSTLLIPSLKTYIEYIPIQNFWMIPGIQNNEPFYGLQAFVHMLQYMLSNNYFDYVIYIDEDCFINDFPALIDEFKNFINSDCCLAGPNDGGLFCHRNHSKFLINTFLSFWNIKMLRYKNISFETIYNYMHDKLKNVNGIFRDFHDTLKQENRDLFDFMEESSHRNLMHSLEFRKTRLLDINEVEYCKTVRNDVNNKIEPNQIPYMYDDMKAVDNFEPYYILEQALVMLTQRPIYYLFGSDLYDTDYKKQGVKFDISGLTSAIYHGDILNEFFDHKLIAVHTWFSRAYTKWPKTQFQLDQTKRINSIIKEFSRL